MIVLDEHFPSNQRQLLQRSRLNFRQIGHEIDRSGLQDDEIIPLLLQLRRPTFFTRDADFYKRVHCHQKYCLVYLDVEEYEAAKYVRWTLRHHEFDTQAKRMGVVVRVSQVGLTIWRAQNQTGIRLG